MLYYWRDNRLAERGFPTEVFVEDSLREIRCAFCGRVHREEDRVSRVEISDGRKWPDILVCDPAIVSERVRDAFVACRLSGFEHESVQVVLETRKLPLPVPSYYFLKVPTGGILPGPETMGRKSPAAPCLPLSEHSNFCRHCGFFSDGKQLMVESFSADMSTWDGKDLVRWAYYRFCSRQVVELILASHWTNFYVQFPRHIGVKLGKAIRHSSELGES